MMIVRSILNGPRRCDILKSTLSLRSRCMSSKSSLSYNRDTGVVSVTDKSVVSSSQPIPIYKSVIGIEIHAQMAVPTKLFSSGPTKHHPDFASSTTIPNACVDLHDIAYPGTLPLLSKSAVQYAIISAAALNCDIQHISRFERKHYSYPDLPLGYQVTQQRWPLAKEGILSCRRYSPPVAKKQKKKKRRRGRDETSTKEVGGHKSGHDDDGAQDTELSKFFQVGIDRIQIEQDTGKTTAVSKGGTDLKTEYLIDYNRAGSTLIEIVFKPQINAAHEAASMVSTLQSLLKYLGTCDGKMEEGSLRCDLNVSIAPIDTKSAINNNIELINDDDNPFQSYLPEGVGHRVEVKNLNSLKQIIQSAEFEALRQTSLAIEGAPTGRETRTFDPKTGLTVKIRDKTGAVDYRFMPEPDLPPVILDKDILDNDTLTEFLEQLPELPEEATTRLMSTYFISEASALIITSDRPAITFYEKAVVTCKKELVQQGDDDCMKKVSVAISNWLCNDLFALIKESATKRGDDQSGAEEGDGGVLNHPISVQYSNVDATRLGSLVSLVVRETVSSTQAKKLLNVMYNDDLVSLPIDIAESNGWKLIKDPLVLRDLCETVILNEKNAKQFEQYKQGGKHVRKMTKFFTGKVMAESKGNAHPEVMAQSLQETLEKLAPGVKA